MRITISSFVLGLSLIPAEGQQDGLNLAGMTLEEIAASKDKVQKIWEEQGVLMHSIPMADAEHMLETLSTEGVAINNDCGPMCSAYTWAKKGIPTSTFNTQGWRVALMFDRKGPYFQQYVHGMLPTDSYTNGRQFCGIPGSESASFKSISPNNLPRGFDQSVGCHEQDHQCRFVAAGGGIHNQRAGGLDDNVQGAWWQPASQFTKTWYGLDSDFTQAQLWQGKDRACRKPNKCSERAAREWFHYNVRLPLEHTETGMFNTQDVQDGISSLSCKLDGQKERHWKYLEKAYIDYLVYIGNYLHTQNNAAGWNEINAYVPPKTSPEYKEAQHLFQESLLGVYFVAPGGAATDPVEKQLAHKLATKMNQVFPRAKLNMYVCQGLTDFSEFKSMHDHPVHELFTQPGQSGCYIPKEWYPSTAGNSVSKQ